MSRSTGPGNDTGFQPGVGSTGGRVPPAGSRRARRHRAADRRYRLRQGVPGARDARIRPEVPLHSDRRAGAGGHQGRSGHQAYSAPSRSITVSGGLNPVAVEIAGRSGCKIVWMPTVDARERNRRAARWRHARSCRSGPRFSASSRLKAFRRRRCRSSTRSGSAHRAGPPVPGAHRQAQHDSRDRPPRPPRDLRARSRRRRDMGVKKVVVTHAEFPSQNLTGDEQKELADLGAIIEHCFTTTYTGKAPWEAAFANIRKTGRVAHDHLHRPRPDHQSAGRRRVRHVCAATAGRRVLGRRCPHDGGHDSDPAGRRIEPWWRMGELGKHWQLAIIRIPDYQIHRCGELDEDLPGRHRRHGRHSHEGAAENRRRRGRVVNSRTEESGKTFAAEWRHSAHLDESRGVHRSSRRRRRDSHDAERACTRTRRCSRCRKASTSRSRFR